MRFFLLFFRFFHRNCPFLVSRPTGRWDLRSHVCPFVRPYARACATLFLGNCSLLFYETLQLVRACKREKKCSKRFFEKIPVLPILSKNWPFWPKMPKMEVFRIFFAIRSLEFANFFLLSLVFGVRKKWCFRIFWENSKMALFGEI